MKSVIFLSGPVGAGKSTVAREMIASSPGPTIYIEGDRFWSFIAKGAESQSRSKNFKMIMTAMTAAAVPYALYGYEVILDFSIPPWFLETALKVLKVKEVLLHYVVVRPSEAVCAARAATRTEGTIADYTPYSELYSSFDEAERYTIGGDEIEAVLLAERIWEGVRAGRFIVS